MEFRIAMNVSALVWPWIAALACLGACGTRQITVHNSVQVTVHAGPHDGTTPAMIDRKDPRIAVAQREIKSVLDRDLAFEVDAALVPHFDAALHAAFVEALETTVTSLHALRDREPELLAFAIKHLETVRWTYSPSQRPSLPTFDPSSGLMAVQVAPDDARLLFGDTLQFTLGRALEAERAARYGEMKPDQVPADEHAAYFEYVTRASVRVRPDGTRISNEEVSLRRIQQVLAFYPRIRDAALQQEARHWLVQAGSRLRSEVVDPPSDPGVAELARRVHPQWIAWLNAHQAELDDADAKRVVDLMFQRHHLPMEPFRHGFDALAFSRPHVHAWVTATRTEASKSRSSQPTLGEALVCPYRQDGRAGYWTASGACTGAVFTALAADAAGRKTLARWLIDEHSEPLTRAAVLHTLSANGPDAIPPLVDAVLAHPETARAALVALAEAPQWGRTHSSAPQPDALVKQIPRWWQSHPKLRPQLLYLTAEIGTRYEGTVVWSKLPQVLGSKVTAQEFAAYLEQGPRAMWSVERLGPVLGDGWSRAAVLVPALGHWLDASVQTGRGGPDPHYVTERIVRLLCTTGTERDYVALQAFLSEYIESHPSQRNNLNSFATTPGSQQCPKWRATPRRGQQPDVLFGD